MRNDVSEPLDRACAGRILPKRNMRSHLVIIDGIFPKDSAKVLRVERDQMISTLAPDRPDQAFSISVLPGRAERGGPVPDAHRSHSSLERAAKCSVIVTDEIFGRRVPREASVIWRASHSAVGFWVTANHNSCRRRWPWARPTTGSQYSFFGSDRAPLCRSVAGHRAGGISIASTGRSPFDANALQSRA
jgi:hypothetical protein